MLSVTAKINMETIWVIKDVVETMIETSEIITLLDSFGLFLKTFESEFLLTMTKTFHLNHREIQNHLEGLFTAHKYNKFQDLFSTYSIQA